MTEGGFEQGGPRDLPADDFELHARKWKADDRLLAGTRKLEEQHGLDPGLFDAVEEAIRRDDHAALQEALADFYEALCEARGL